MRSLLPLICLAILGSSSAAEDWQVDGELARNSTGSFSRPGALWRVIELCGPGDRVFVQPGRYMWGVVGRLGAAPHGSREAPIEVRALGEVVIERQDWSGGATLSIHSGSWVTFYGFHFEGSWTGIFFHPNFPDGNVGWHFVDCEIDGTWDWHHHRSRHDNGLASKWGVIGWSLSDFTWERGSIHDVYFEHAMYLHNPLGDITIVDAKLERVGRTAVQIRSSYGGRGQAELPRGRGRVTVQGCTIRDTGLADGGSALTLAGRNDVQARFVDNTITFGDDPLLVARWLTRRPKHRFGAGAIVAWEEYAGQINGTIEVVDNTILYAPRCGDRVAVQLGSARSIVVTGNRIEVADAEFPGSHAVALVVNPRDRRQPELPMSGYSDAPEVVVEGNTVTGRTIITGVEQP